MNDKTIVELKVTRNVETGERHLSDLVDCDFAIGNYLAKSIQSLVETSTSKRHESLVSFCNRPSNKQVIHCQEEDPKEFLQRMRNKVIKADEEGVRKSKSSLPIVYFHRSTGLGTDDAANEIYIRDVGQIVDDPNAGSPAVVAMLDEMPVMATYNIYVLAWDELTLHKLIGALMFTLAGKSRSIEYVTSLLSDVIPVKANLPPIGDMLWSDASSDQSQGRLLVATTSIDVKTKIYQARCIKQGLVTLAIMEPAPLFGSSSEVLNV